jgi:GNAT superfamily N-acetyltransferase
VGIQNKEHSIEIVKASHADAPAASTVMIDAALSLQERGEALWKAEELGEDQLIEEITAGRLYLIKDDGMIIGTVIFQWEDQLYWPDMPGGDAAYIHKLVLKKSAAGSGLGREIIAWAREKALRAGRNYLRLDCEAHRSRLCSYYESAGFIRHSERQVGRQYLARYEMDIEDQA